LVHQFELRIGRQPLQRRMQPLPGVTGRVHASINALDKAI
jgi:hypothetical protein